MRYSEIFKEAKRLHGLGFGVLWLHPRSKRPVESGWTKGDRQTWEELEATYRPGYNLGVRTGQASKLPHGYLACIDVDIKDEAFRPAALARLKQLLGGQKLPEVRSGSGNGSRHLYCVTSSPFKMITIAKSVETYKDEKDRKHHKWEICVYSTGRQMVLPPSVHPDSGKLYSWHAFLTKGPDLPLMGFGSGVDVTACLESGGSGQAVNDDDDDFDFRGHDGKGGGSVRAAHLASERSEGATLQGFKVEPVDMGWLQVSDEIKDAILTGEGVTNRSDYLLRVTNAMLSAEYSQNQILTVLTDPFTYLGACGYEHAKTADRAVAANWVYRYTFLKAQTERDPSSIFSRVKNAAPPRKLTEEEVAQQTEEMMEEIWKSSDHGFYHRGPKGAFVPDYESLLAHFIEANPYKSVADMKAVYVFNGTHYEDVTPIELKSFAEKNFVPKPEDKVRNEFWNKVLVNNVTRRRFFIETTEGKINFKNGILDLNSDSKKLAAHTPEIGFRGVLPYDYDPTADCPVFKKWLNGVMLGDQDLVMILQEFMGYVVRGGDYKYHKALWVGGVGRNGKSTFIDVLKALIGPGNFSTLSIKSLITDKFAGADLDGKIANFSEETSPEEIADSGPFKNLTGDGDISAQKKFGDIYSFRNRAKLIMSYNTIPNLKDLSAGMLSRPLIVPFKKVIKESDQDHDIKKKLFKEMSGIFNFALRGWHRLERQNQFTTSAVSDEALQTIKEESCNVTQWVNHYLEVKEKFDAKDLMTVTTLYAAYRSVERYPYGLSGFGRKLRAHPKLEKRWDHDRNGAFYRGIRVK